MMNTTYPATTKPAPAAFEGVMPLVLAFVEELNKKDVRGFYQIDPLRKYLRITVDTAPEGKYGKSVYCFIDAEGTLLKPKGYNTPAKHARAFLTEESLERLVAIADPYGGWLYL